MVDTTPLNGSCLCGAVRFEVMSPTRWCAHCHCSLCRRAHGAAFVTWFGVDRSSFELVSGTDELSWYQSTPAARRGFCSRCGSTIFFESERWADEVHIALACMEGAIDRSPNAHVFYDSHVDWIELGDELRRLGGPKGTDPIEPAR
ncbi:MAG: GFA family protein [Acidobacteriota bacterium]